jgi:IclR family transcriptional regulator, KDG regulon repressor
MENTSRTVNKAIDILEIFLQKDGGLTLTEVSKSTKLNTATAYRLVTTLAKRGYLSQYQKKGAYSLGLKMLDFNYAIHRNLKFIDFAYLSLSKVSKDYNVSTFVAVLDADMMLIVEEIGASGELRINSPIGKRLPLYCTGCGKVLLSGLSEDERKAYYKRIALQPYTSSSITDIPRLENEIAMIKAEGAAYHKEEYRQGVWVAAAPILNGSEKVIAAVAIILPVSYLGFDSIQKYTTAIKGCAGEISQVISRIS